MGFYSIEKINSKIKIYTKWLFSNVWFPILKNSELQRAKNTRICNYFCMKIEKPLLLWTLITMVPLVFENFDFKGYLSHSIFWKCLMRFFGSGTSPWTQISYEGTIFDAEHDDLKIFRIFENFGKSRNQFWDPPICKSGMSCH